MNSNAQAGAADRVLPEAFEGFYRQHMEPALLQLEQKRRKTAGAVKALAALAILGALPLVLGMLGMDVSTPVFLASLFGLFAGVMGATWFSRRFRGSLKHALVKPVCQFFGYDYEAKPQSFALDRFVDTGIVPHQFKRSRLEDRISGEHNGVAFELCEVRLLAHKNDDEETETMFFGVMLQYTFAKPFSGVTRVLPNAPIIGRFQRAGLKAVAGSERVILEDPRFERAFRTWSTDQVEARYLLTPRFMERLTELAAHFSNPVVAAERAENAGMPLVHQLRLAFEGEHLLIAVPTKHDRFEGGGLFRSLLARDRITELVHELALVRDIVDVLKLEQTSRA